MSPPQLPVPWCAILIVSCSLAASTVQAKYGYFTIVAPGTIRSNSLYHISVSLSAFAPPCVFEFSIEQSRDSHDVSKFVQIKPGTTELVQMEIPRLLTSRGVLQARGVQGIVMYESSLLNIETLSYSVFLQTDKSKYRPGDVMQFRVICVDRLTRPASIEDEMDVQIFDGDENFIKLYPKIKLVQGVFKTSFELSEFPVLGEWKINVNSNGHSVAEKRFQVARYFLPNFAIQISTKNAIALNAGQIEMMITASYVYGEPVDGNMTLYVLSRYTSVEHTHEIKIKKESINGTASIVLDLKNDVGIPTETDKQTFILLHKLAVAVIVHDRLTNQTSSSLEEINIYSCAFKISVSIPERSDVDRIVKVKVCVKDVMDNPVDNASNPVRLTVTNSYTNDISEYSLYLSGNGVNITTLNLTDGPPIEYYSFLATYQGCRSTEERLPRVPFNMFTLKTLTESPQVGNELVVQLRSTDPISHFVYELISRGDIIETKQIEVPGNQTTYLIHLNTTHEMVPKLTLFVHRTLNGIFDSNIKDIYIKRAFRNSIRINTDLETHPGALVSVNVTTDPDSYIGLMGVDHKLLIDPNYQADLTEDHIFTQLRNYDSINMDSALYPGREAGLITFSNTRNRKGDDIGKVYFVASGASRPQPLPRAFDKPSVELPYVRRMFSESWMFTDVERTPDKEFTIKDTIPDTITSWAISGFSLNPNTGLTLTKNITNVKVFQEFFVSMELPHAVKEGEILEIPVFVFNYMNETLSVDVTIDNPTGGLELFNNITSSSSNQSNRTIAKRIPPGGRERLAFLVKTPKTGMHNVTVRAISPLASDAIQKTLNVEPAGIPHSVSKTYLVHFLDNSKQEDEIFIDIPDNRVPNSEVINLSMVGDIFGPLMRQLEKMARVPYGNARENMDYFISNLLVLKYLQALNQTNPTLESKAKLHLELGYQNQLAFKQVDGSFSLITQPVNRTGDLLVTIYTVWGFTEAKEFITIDQERIRRGIAYLVSNQDENGSFKPDGSTDENVALTSFAMLLLSANVSHTQMYREPIERGLEYLYDTLDDLEDIESVAMPTYALIVGGHNQSMEVLKKLSTSQSLTGKAVMWTKPESLQSSLQTTAASFMSLLESQGNQTQNLLPIVRALTSPGQNAMTPAHIIALKVLIEFAKGISIGKKDLTIHFSDDQGSAGDHHIDSQTAQVLKTVQLSKDSRKVRLITEGNGFAIANIVYRYNLPPVNQTSSDYRANVTIKKSNDVVTILEICIAFQSQSSENRTNLTKVEVNLQSGYIANKNAFDDILQFNEFVQVIRLNGREDSVLMYLCDIHEIGSCLELKTWKRFLVHNAKPASVVVYDAFGNGQHAVSFYSK